jgi:hypothetical protein
MRVDWAYLHDGFAIDLLLETCKSTDPRHLIGSAQWHDGLARNVSSLTAAGKTSIRSLFDMSRIKYVDGEAQSKKT